MSAELFKREAVAVVVVTGGNGGMDATGEFSVDQASMEIIVALHDIE